MPTIKEIAQMIGVSPTTVSNVIQGNTKKVSPETLEKVRAMLKQEKYTPNMGAMILAQNNSRIVGIILFTEPRKNETLFEDPFNSAILGSLEQEIRANGYFTMLAATNNEEDVLRLASTWKLAGLVLLWTPEEISEKIVEQVTTPIVFVDCYFSRPKYNYYKVGLDDRRGGYEVCRYLLSMNHTNIALFTNDEQTDGSDMARFLGCRDAFSERDLIFPIDRFIPLSKDLKERETEYLKAVNGSFKFTACMFCSDYYAAEATLFYQDVGIAIPDQVSITGFDDNAFSRLVRPRITTVHQDVFKKGQIAIQTLIKLIKQEPVSEKEVRLPVALKIRDSVRKLEL